MKVLHIINSLAFGGAEKLIVDSLPFYMEGVEAVELLVLKKVDKEFPINMNVKINYINSNSFYNPLIVFKLIPYLKKFDIVHLHLFPTLYWGVMAKSLLFRKGPKLVFTEHNTDNRRRSKFIFKIVDRLIYNKLDFIGCISQGTKNNLVKHLNTKTKNIKVINNGIILDDFQADKRIKSYNFFDENNFIIIQVSSFREQKDQATLIRAIKFLPDNIKLLLVGEGHLKVENQNLVKELSLEERIKFLGIRKDIPDLLNYADVCVLSSNYEGFGLAILEGMASKRPSIASNVEGVSEIVKNYGLVFERGNERELATHINKLYSDNEFYNRIAQQCYERSKQFDIRKMVASYIGEYKNLLKNAN